MVNIKPMSVNEAWQGKRYKTNKYKKYERDLLMLLPDIELPEPPYSIYYEFGFSSKGSDIDNPIKLLQDILQKRYNFNDSLVYRLEVVKKIVPKGKEYIDFKIKQLQ